MSIKSDKWIRRMAQDHNMIEPFEYNQIKNVNGEKVISFGTSSYGYDIRCADEFKVFTNINSTIVDPKNFDPDSFVEVSGKGYCIIPPNSFALARTVEYFRIPLGTDGLPGQIDLCALRHHRQCHPFRTGMGRLCHAGVLQYHPVAGQNLCQRRRGTGAVLRIRRSV
jgi:hypothetical protein